ncbi:MAG: helix-turn-helix domain-containing protein [Anaerolineales bacterium]|nr:helix-turn-helix domain-containing protein [Anaerolineales bacterium]
MDVRPLTAHERAGLEGGPRSPEAFTLRRCQIVLANARGQTALQIAEQLRCSDQTVRNALHAFKRQGLASLQPASSVAHHVARAFDGARAERLCALLHQSPRTFGKPTSLWTLELAAEVADAEGITSEQVSGEMVRATLQRLGAGWRRAKEWITSPDPE